MMKDLFAEDSLLTRILSAFSDWMVLNACFVLGSLGIITIGASWTAMYSVSLKLDEHRHVHIWRDFWTSYRKNFRQATILWMILAASICMLAFDIWLTARSGQFLFSVYQTMMAVLLACTLGIAAFAFPLLAKFDNTVTGTLKNAFLILFRDFQDSALVFLSILSVLFLSLYSRFTLAWAVGIGLIFGFGMLAAWLSRYYNRIFEKYIVH